MAKTLQEIDKIERSLFMLHWYENLDLRSHLNALTVFFNRLGELRDRSSRLTFLCVATAMWNAVYLGRAVETLKAMGEDEYLVHLSPLECKHITLTGIYRWNLDSPWHDPKNSGLYETCPLLPGRRDQIADFLRTQRTITAI